MAGDTFIGYIGYWEQTALYGHSSTHSSRFKIDGPGKFCNNGVRDHTAHPERQCGCGENEGPETTEAEHETGDPALGENCGQQEVLLDLGRRDEHGPLRIRLF
jgi:hypothetical protein